MTTRVAHREREAWLRNAFEELGLETLRGKELVRTPNGWAVARPADDRLTREFPEPGDNSCYASCLLRIKLLRGEKLAPWQIFKAIRSSIQKRGYDPNIPWKNRETKKTGKDDGETPAVVFDEDHLRKVVGENPDWLYPCYLDAFRMGLWDPKQPAQLKTRIDHRAQSTRKMVWLRSLVEKEARALLAAAARQIPALAGKEEYVLYGPSGKYSSSSVRAGALAQKVPRFDNRIIDKCSLIPRLNVCKIRMEGKRIYPPQYAQRQQPSNAKGSRGAIVRKRRSAIPLLCACFESPKLFSRPRPSFGFPLRSSRPSREADRTFFPLF